MIGLVLALERNVVVVKINLTLSIAASVVLMEGKKSSNDHTHKYDMKRNTHLSDNLLHFDHVTF